MRSEHPIAPAGIVLVATKMILLITEPAFDQDQERPAPAPGKSSYETREEERLLKKQQKGTRNPKILYLNWEFIEGFYLCIEMKKFLIILIMLVYGFSSMGMSINLHYCCGKLDDISFSSPKEKSCAKDQDGISKKRCCDNKHLEFKLKADYEPSAKWIQAYKQLTSPALDSYYFISWQPQYQPVNELATGPPLTPSSLPLFIKNSVFRI